MAGQDDDDMKAELSSILEVNALDYRLAPSLSVATSRQMKAYRAANVRYNFGEQINITLSAGAAVIDPKNSYVSLDIVMPKNPVPYDNINLPTNGGWTQLFQKYNLMHSSGVELDRIADSAGEYQQIKDYYEHDERWRATVGGLWNHQDGGRNLHLGESAVDLINASVAATQAPPNPTLPYESKAAHPVYNQAESGLLGGTSSTPLERHRIQIPLCEVAPFFNSNLLMPSFLAAGLRMELTTNTLAKFFAKIDGAFGAGTDDVPVIEQVFVNLESFQLTDSITRKLSQISASSGLEWSWTAVHQAATTQTVNEFSFQVSRALSRANNVICKVRRTAAVKSPIADSFTSLPWVSDRVKNDPINYYRNEVDINDGTLEGFQVQLGSQFIPAAPLDNTLDFYTSALKTFGAFRRTDASVGPTRNEWEGQVLGKSLSPGAAGNLTAAPDGRPVYGTCLAVAAVPLESSSTLNESGAAISAQRTAVINIKSRTTVSKRYDFFVEYSKLATIFLDSVVVRS